MVAGSILADGAEFQDRRIRPLAHLFHIQYQSMLIGLVADTHGYLDPRVPPALRGVDLILHAGDIGAEEVLVGLTSAVPVTAVVGNNDSRLAHLGLPLRVDVDLEGVRIHLVHRLIDAAPGPDTRVVVYGHSHKALVAERGGMLWVNPGAAGRVGFHREVTVAFLRVEKGCCEAELVLLGPRVPAASRSAASGGPSRDWSKDDRKPRHRGEEWLYAEDDGRPSYR